MINQWQGIGSSLFVSPPNALSFISPHAFTHFTLQRQGLLSGDASQWDRALQMPHYGAKAMPACSLNQCKLFINARFN